MKKIRFFSFDTLRVRMTYSFSVILREVCTDRRISNEILQLRFRMTEKKTKTGLRVTGGSVT